MIDRFVVASLAAMYAIIPMYGTYAVFAPHPPIAPLVPRPIVFVFVAVMLAAMIGVTIGAVRRKSRPALYTVLVVNVIATYVGAAFGFDPGIGLFLATGCAGFVATHFALIAYYRDRNVARSIYLALLSAGFITAILAIVMLVLKRPADLYSYNHGRAVATFLNPNELAAYLLTYLGVSCGIAIARRGTRTGTFAAVCSAVGILALTLTFSRWAVLAALCGLAVYLLVMRPRRSSIAAVLVVVALAAGVNLALWTRHHDPQDTEIRGVAWSAGITTFLHFPLTGVGPLAFGRLYPVMRAPDAPGPDTPVAYDPHDLPLSIAAETGVFGLGAFVWLVWSIGREFRRAIGQVNGDRRTLGMAIMAGIVALLVHSLINSVSDFFPLFLQFSALALAATYWGFDPDAA
jgi:O-antigen ligase